MIEKFRTIWKIPDLRRSILFVLAMMVVFRLAAHIPVPGISAAGLQDFLASNAIFGLLNVFTGGGLENMSIVMLGLGPYITASIIFQLLVMVVPRLEELSKEGEYGQRKINQYTRWATIPLSLVQAYATITLLRQSSGNLLADLSLLQTILIMVTATAGSMFLLWIGELISERKVGNGVSLLIFAGIIASLPAQIRGIAVSYDASQLFNLVLFVAVALITIVGIVFITEGQRKLPVSYARRVRGNKVYGGVNTYLPLRVNQAGVIPIIFAISLLLIPPVVGQFLSGSSVAWLANLGSFVANAFANQTIYGAMYFFLVVAFTYFYTAVIFHPQQIAENLQKQGGFIPGIRPGGQTEEYIGKTSNRIMLAGALFLGVIAVLPTVVKALSGWELSVVGGTSILIVVSVVIESVKQINAQLVMRDYDEV